MQFVGSAEEQVDKLALLQTNSKQAGMEANDSANGNDAAFTKCKTLYSDEKKKYLYDFLTLINPVCMLSDMNEKLSLCKSRTEQKMGNSDIANTHMLALQHLLRNELSKPYVNDQKQAWELALNILSEHLHTEFTSRGRQDVNVREFLLMFVLEIMTDLENDALKKICVENWLLWRLHMCEILTQLVSMWLKESNLILDESSPEMSPMSRLYLYQFTKTSTVFWMLASASKLQKYSKLPSLIISAKTLANLHDSYSIRICYFCQRISTVRFFSKCEVCKCVYFCSVKCQKEGHEMHRSEMHCTSNMQNEHRLKILALNRLVSCLMSTAFVSYLDNKYISIDESTSLACYYVTFDLLYFLF